MPSIYKILPRTLFEEAQRAGVFHGSEVDLRDGYIHFSTAEQARETAAKHFAGQHGLMVLEIEAAAPGSVQVDRVRVAYRDGVQWGVQDAGVRTQVAVLGR